MQVLFKSIFPEKMLTSTVKYKMAYVMYIKGVL